jgi:hypothetical protein
MRKLISVCGSDKDDENLSNHALAIAETIGKLIAKNDGVLVCGGRGGIMRAACKGAKDENGITVGILPGGKEGVNEFVDVVIPTGLGTMRNFLVVNAGDVVVAIGGRWGTLNEISFAMIVGKPLVLVRGTGGCVDALLRGSLLDDISGSYCVVGSAEEAVEKAFELC